MAGGYFAFFVLAHRAFAAVWPSVRRFVKLALVASNPVRGIEKFQGTGGRLVCLTGLREAAVRDALSSEIRLYFVFALNTGFRWSKQMDHGSPSTSSPRCSRLGRTRTARRSVPFNTATEGVLLEMGAQRLRPNDPHEPVFPVATASQTSSFELSSALRRLSERLVSTTKQSGSPECHGTA